MSEPATPLIYEGKDLNKCNNIHTFILRIEKDEPTIFKEIGIQRCEDCGATGLDYYDGNGDDEIMVWQGEYCRTCNGIGYLYDKDELCQKTNRYICPFCDGSGHDCDRCINGITDWITYLVGGK
jgi:hypothetical protein